MNYLQYQACLKAYGLYLYALPLDVFRLLEILTRRMSVRLALIYIFIHQTVHRFQLVGLFYVVSCNLDNFLLFGLFWAITRTLFGNFCTVGLI